MKKCSIAASRLNSCSCNKSKHISSLHSVMLFILSHLLLLSRDSSAYLSSNKLGDCVSFLLLSVPFTGEPDEAETDASLSSRVFALSVVSSSPFLSSNF